MERDKRWENVSSYALFDEISVPIDPDDESKGWESVPMVKFGIDVVYNDRIYYSVQKMIEAEYEEMLNNPALFTYVLDLMVTNIDGYMAKEGK